jgi:hypothetical protein
LCRFRLTQNPASAAKAAVQHLRPTPSRAPAAPVLRRARAVIEAHARGEAPPRAALPAMQRRGEAYEALARRLLELDVASAEQGKALVAAVAEAVAGA